jgi:hypothetical protein
MIINKARGQSLKELATDLREECFSCGELVICFLLKRWFYKRLIYRLLLAYIGKTTNVDYKEDLC